MQRSIPAWLSRIAANLQSLNRRARRASRRLNRAASRPHSFQGLDPLEGRTLMSVAINAQGWTDIGASADTRTIYVSSSTGADTNNGLSTGAAVKTIAAAQKLVRSGYADWILLKKGDVFRESLFWRLNGRSASEPMVLGSYGSGARPSIRPPAGQDGIQMFPSTSVNNVAILGIDLYDESRDPANGSPSTATTTGIFALGNVNNLLIEDSSIRFFNNNLVVEQFDVNHPSNLQVRRSILADAYSVSAHAQGAYLDGINGILLEENLFDHNGYNDAVSGADKTMYNHNVYMQSNNTGTITVRNNISTRASSHGMQARSGGTITGNIADGNAIGILVGGGDSPAAGGVVANLSDNVVLESGDFGDNYRGWAFDVTNLNTGVISGNIAAHERSAGTNGHGIDIDKPYSGATLTNNIVFDWQNPLVLNDAGPYVTQSNNQLTGLGGANPLGYADPNRTLASYNATLGGASTLDAFVARARQQSRDNWSDAYTASAANAYIRAGFNISAGDSTAPQASLAASDVNAAGATSYSFTVTYTDNAALDVASLNTGDVRVTGPNGYSQIATLTSLSSTSNGPSCTATYTITPPGEAWSLNDNGAYAVSLVAGQVADTSGNTVAATNLGGFTVGIAPPDLTDPTARLSLVNDVNVAGGTGYYFTVTYSDNVAIDPSTIDGQDVVVTGPGGLFTQLASLVNVDSSAAGSPRYATYRFNAPGGSWTLPDNGTYTLTLRYNQVTDTSGKTVGGTTLGAFQVNIPSVAAPTTTFSAFTGFGDRMNFRTITPARWNVTTDNGNAVLSLNNTNYDPLPGGRLGELAAVNGSSFGDLSMSVRARTAEKLASNSRADYALVFGRVDGNNYNYMMMNADSGSTQLYSVINGERQLVATATTRGIPDQSYHNVNLFRYGTQVVVALDGVTILTADDRRLAAVGGVGLGSYNDAAFFDDFNVTAPQVTTIDNTSSKVFVTSGVSAVTNLSGYYGSNYLSDGNAGKGSRSVSYFPALAAGVYQVRLYSPGAQTLASNVQVDIYTAGRIVKTVYWNQTVAGFTSLGAFNLDSDSKLVIRNTGTTAEVIADAVQFIA